MSNHTPGPWRMDYGPFTGGGKYLRVHCGRNPVAGQIVERFYEFPGGCNPTEEQVANARLIAAAPDLLEALEQVQTALACYRDNLPIPNGLSIEEIKYVVVDAAIAKATPQPVSA